MKVSKTKKLIITLVSISLVLIYCLINDPSREITLTLGLYAGSSWDVPNGESYQVIDQAIQKFEKKYPSLYSFQYSPFFSSTNLLTVITKTCFQCNQTNSVGLCTFSMSNVSCLG